MDQIGVRELRQNASKYLERVERGESIEVTVHGKPVAVLRPVEEDPWKAMIAAGEVTPAELGWDDLPPPLPAPEGLMSASDMLQAQRAERFSDW